MYPNKANEYTRCIMHGTRPPIFGGWGGGAPTRVGEGVEEGMSLQGREPAGMRVITHTHTHTHTHTRTLMVSYYL